MKFLEKDLEQIIFTTPQDKLVEKGFSEAPRIMRRQLALGNYGRLDLIGYDHDWRWIDDSVRRYPLISIIELKQDRISVSAFLQALNYVKGVKHYLRKHNPYLSEIARYQLVLIGKSIDDSGSFVYIPELLSKPDLIVSFYTYEFDFEGMSFKSHEHYQLTNPGF